MRSSKIKGALSLSYYLIFCSRSELIPPFPTCVNKWGRDRLANNHGSSKCIDVSHEAKKKTSTSVGINHYFSLWPATFL